MSDWSPECEALFEAGRQADDDPSPDDRRRVARRVAARLAIGVTVVTTAGAGRAATAGAAGASGLAAKAPSLLTVGKILLALAVSVGAGAGIGEVLLRQHRAPAGLRSTPPSAAPPLTLAASPRTQAVVAHEPAPAASAFVLPAAQPTQNRPARSVARGTRSPITAPAPAPTDARRSPSSEIADPTPASAASSIPSPYDATGEIRALKEIDEAIRRGDFPRASALLNEYEATAGTKHFAPEYKAARALVLCGSGQTAAGQKAACAFLSAYPRSPMSARIEAACSARCDER